MLVDSVMERSFRIFTYEEAALADREERASLSPQERLDRVLLLHEEYRRTFGDAGIGLVCVVRIVPTNEPG